MSWRVRGVSASGVLAPSPQLNDDTGRLECAEQMIGHARQRPCSASVGIIGREAKNERVYSL